MTRYFLLFGLAAAGTGWLLFDSIQPIIWFCVIGVSFLGSRVARLEEK